MISLRSHVVTVLAVLMALAVGIALGSGPLQTEIEARPTSSGDADDLREAEARADALSSGTEHSDAFALSVSDRLVRDALDGRTVTMLLLPGAAPETVAGLTDMVARAGGRVVSQARVDEQLLDVGNRQLVGELGTQMVDTVQGAVRVPAEAGDYERMGRLLARALVTDERGGSEVDAPGTGILAGLETAGLVTVTEGQGARGSLLLAVGGAPYGTADVREGAGTIVASLLAEAARSARAVVLAGPAGSGDVDGLVGRLRAEEDVRGVVSSVDVADRVTGRIATVLALAADVSGDSGHYGSTSAPDGPRPPPAAG